MKKKNVLLLSVFIALVLLTGGVGVIIGSIFYDKMPFYTEKDVAQEMSISSDKIAVVNLDVGITRNSNNVKYFEKIVKFPSDNFEYTSLDNARTGLINGDFGAYIVIPSSFSESVESINGEFHAADLDYEISNTITDADRCSVLTNMMVFSQNLNKDLSYIYVDNVMEEFHDAQDNALVVMENDLTDKQVIDDIEPNNLIETVTIPELKTIENNTEILDISEYMDENNRIIAELGDNYKKAVDENSKKIQDLVAEGDKVVTDLTGLLSENNSVDIRKDAESNDIYTQAQDKLKEQLDKEADDRKIINNSTKKEIDQAAIYLKDAVKIIKGSQYTYEDEHGISHTIPADEYKVVIRVLKPGRIGNNEDDYEDREVTLLELLEGKDEGGEHVNGLIDNLEERSLILEDDEGMLYRDEIEEVVDDYYFGTIKDNVERVQGEFVDRNSKEKTRIGEYRDKLLEYKSVDESGYVSEATGNLLMNNNSLYNAVIENTTNYMTYANDVYSTTGENTNLLIENIRKANEESNDKVKEGVAQAQFVKGQTSDVNQTLMGAFTKKLPGTRLGSLAYRESYEFIVNPIRLGEDITLIEQSNKTGSEERTYKNIYEINTGAMVIVLLTVALMAAAVSIYSISISKHKEELIDE